MSATSTFDLIDARAEETWNPLPPAKKAQNWIPDSFRNAVLLHIVKNEIEDVNPTLLLAIQGGMGEGKSYQVREVCSQLGVYVLPLSGAALSGSYEGEPLKIFQSAYLFASAFKAKANVRFLILIDDFDLSPASTFDDRRYTVNTQLLAGFLMNLADDPHTCAGRSTLRIPIILTGNNFTALHGPLTRHGRMTFFDWEPSIDDKIGIVRSIFSSILQGGDLDGVARLVHKFKKQPVSFFAALREDLINGAILQVVSRGGTLRWESYSSEIQRALQSQSLSELYRLGERRASAVARKFL